VELRGLERMIAEARKLKASRTEKESEGN
jgi:hypothetical protein